MINVCHVTTVHSRYDVRIFHKECVSLYKAGYKVYLLVNDNEDDELIEGVNILSTSFSPKKRIERMISSKRHIRRKMMEIDANIYHFHDPELLIEALWIKRRGKKAIFDSHEDYYLTISEKQWLPRFMRKIIARLYLFFEKRVIKRLDATVTCYHWTRDRYLLNNKNTSMILNYPILPESLPSSDIFSARAISFAGGISRQWCHKEIILALSNLDDVVYELAGKRTKYLEELESLDGWRKVNFHGMISHEDVMNNVYAQSSIGMALLDYIAQCKGNVGNLSNTKFFEYMLMGLPLICTDFKLWKEIIDEEECGICVNPHNIDEISNAIQYLLDHPEISVEMGKNGQKAVIEKYNWSTEEKKLLDIYKKMNS